MSVDDDTALVALGVGLALAVLGIGVVALSADVPARRDADTARCDAAISRARSDNPDDMSRFGRRACLRVWGYR